MDAEFVSGAGDPFAMELDPLSTTSKRKVSVRSDDDNEQLSPTKKKKCGRPSKRRGRPPKQSPAKAESIVLPSEVSSKNGFLLSDTVMVDVPCSKSNMVLEGSTSALAIAKLDGPQEQDDTSHPALTKWKDSSFMLARKFCHFLY